MMLNCQCMQDQTKIGTKLNNNLTRIKNFAEIPHDGHWLIRFFSGVLVKQNVLQKTTHWKTQKGRRVGTESAKEQEHEELKNHVTGEQNIRKSNKQERIGKKENTLTTQTMHKRSKKTTQTSQTTHTAEASASLTFWLRPDRFRWKSKPSYKPPTRCCCKVVTSSAARRTSWWSCPGLSQLFRTRP